MKKIIILILVFLIAIPFSLADGQINIEIETNENLQSTIVEVADGNIHNDIYCNAGGDCTNNLYSGDLSIPGENPVTVNTFFDKLITTDSGLSMGKFLHYMTRALPSYANEDKPKYDSSSWNVWALLDSYFVSHKEINPTVQNTLYLAEEIDLLKAENELLKKHLGLQINEEDLECQKAINTAKRLGKPITMKNGAVVNIKTFGEQCVTITPTITP